MAATPSYTLTSSSALSDDYIWTADVLIDATSSSPVSVFNYQNNPQALFIRSDGVLCHITPSTGKSSAGWAVRPLTASGGIAQTVAGLQKDGSIHGFYTDTKNTYHISLDESGWSAPDTLPLCSRLRIVTNGLTGELVAYGVDTNGHLLLIRQSGAAWGATALAQSPSLIGLKPVLMLTDENCDWVMAIPGSASTGGYLDLYQGSASSVLSGPVHVPVPNPVQEVVYGYWNNNSALFLFTDSANNFYSNAGSTTAIAQIPSMSVARAAGIVDLSNNLHIYATDPSGNLSVLHQTDWDYNSNTPVWAPVIPLDKGLHGLFADSNPMDTVAFFAIDGDGALWRYSKSLDSETGNKVWATHKAQMPNDAAQSYRVAQYRTEITIKDQNGNPAPNLSLTVSASSNCSVLVKGLSYSIGPSQTATITTGSTGKAHLSTIAYDLVAPRLTFAAPGLTITGAVNPAGPIHSYLTGAGTLNGGTSQQRPTFSGSTIQRAQVNNSPLAPATQDPSNGLTLANTACSGIQSVLQIPTIKSFVSSASPNLAGFALDLSDRQKPVFQAFATEQEYQTFRHENGMGMEKKEALLGSWWDDIADFAEDLWHGIRRAAISVTKFVVHTADAAMDLVVKIGNDIHNITGAFVAGIESAVSAIQGIFAWIGTEVEKIIEWLKMLFDWEDILNTSKALEAALSGSFGYVQGVITQHGGQLVNGFFSNLEEQVKSSFTTVRNQFTADQTLRSLVPLPGAGTLARQNAAAMQTLSLSPSDFLSWSSNVQNNWLIEKIETFLGLGPNWNTVSSLTPILETLQNSFATVASDFQTAATDFAEAIVVLFKEPSQFPTYGVADFLGSVENLCLAALAFLDGIIEAFMQAVSVAFASANEILSAPLEIPFLSGLWNMLGNLFGLDMPSFTVSGVFCLALAIPTTLLYKLVNGPDTQPFPGGVLPSGDMLKAVRPGVSLGSNASKGMQYTAAGISAIWALFDTALDAVPEVTLTFFKIIDILAPTLIQVFTWPTGIPFQVVPMNTNQERASFADWVIGFSVIGFDIAVLLSTVKWDPDSDIGRKIDPIGKLVVTALGAIDLTAGVIASSFGESAANIASSIVGPLPQLMQFLTLNSLNDALEGLPLAIKLIIDFFAGEGEAVAIAVA